jgi:hypothetical protein
MMERIMVLFRAGAVVCLFVSTVIAVPAEATEGGKQHFPIGLQTAVPAILPQEGGLQFYNYNFYYTADRLNDSNANKLPIDFNLDVAGTAERIVYSYPLDLGNITLASGAAVNLLHQDLKLNGSRGKNVRFGDLNIEPIIVGWSNKKNLWLLAAPNLWAPIGSYKSSRLVNAGLNYWSVDMELAATWMPTPKWELSIDTFTGFALQSNSATKYRSGNTFSADFVVGYRPFRKQPKLQVSVQGDVFKQFSDDKISGISVGPDGYRGQQFAIGPQLRWDFTRKSGVLVKYQREFAVENRAQGNKFWLEFIAPIS